MIDSNLILAAAYCAAEHKHDDIALDRIYFDGFNIVGTNRNILTVVRQSDFFTDEPFSVNVTRELLNFLVTVKSGQVDFNHGLFMTPGSVMQADMHNAPFIDWRAMFPVKISDHLPNRHLGVDMIEKLSMVCRCLEIGGVKIRQASDGSDVHVVTYNDRRDIVSIMAPYHSGDVPDYLDVWERFV